MLKLAIARYLTGLLVPSESRIYKPCTQCKGDYLHYQHPVT